MTDEGTCKGDSCGWPLVVMEWNSDADILICENIQCKLYHTPAGHVPKGVRFKAPRKPKTKMPDWLGGPQSGTENTGFARRLQRLRDYIYTEE